MLCSFFTLCLIPKEYNNSLTPSVITLSVCTNSHCPDLLTVPSVSINPLSSSILCSIDDCKYILGICLFSNTPISLNCSLNLFLFPFPLYGTPISTPMLLVLSPLSYIFVLYPSFSICLLISSMSSSEQVISVVFLSPSPNHTPNVYGFTINCCSGYSTGSFIGTRYLYSNPFPSFLIFLKSFAISLVVILKYPCRSLYLEFCLLPFT